GGTPMVLQRFAWFAIIAALGVFPSAADAAEAPGLGDPGKLQKLEVIAGSEEIGRLRGADDRLQLVVSGVYDSGQFRDYTRKVAYETEPSGIVQIDATGMVTPLANGQTVITARSPEGATGQVAIEVSHVGNELPINFPNEIVPIFTKL